MRWLYRAAAAFLVLLASLFAWIEWWPHDERTAAVFSEGYGSTTSDTKFGVSPGMSWREADTVLRRQFSPAFVVWWIGTPEQLALGGTSHSDPVLTGLAKVSYRDRSWRNGVITMHLRDGRVTKVSWSYAGPFYLDF